MKCPYTREECMSDCAMFITTPSDVNDNIKNQWDCRMDCRIALWYQKNLIQIELLSSILIDLNSMQKQEGGLLKALLKSAGLG